MDGGVYHLYLTRTIDKAELNARALPKAVFVRAKIRLYIHIYIYIYLVTKGLSFQCPKIKSININYIDQGFVVNNVQGLISRIFKTEID